MLVSVQVLFLCGTLNHLAVVVSFKVHQLIDNKTVYVHQVIVLHPYTIKKVARQACCT